MGFAIPKAAQYAMFGGLAASGGLLATNTVASAGIPSATRVAAALSVSSAAAGAFLRSSMAQNEKLRPYAAVLTGLGLGGTGGIAYTAFENGLPQRRN